MPGPRARPSAPAARPALLAALPAAVLATVLAGCATAPPPHGPEPVAAPVPPAAPAVDGARLTVIFASLQQVGVPYAYGGASPAGFDCSGLVQYVFANAGFPLPRTAAAQHAAASPLPLTDAAPGDLLFFRDRGTTSHVGIYVGDGRFVHAPRTGRNVALDRVDDDYWRRRFAGAGRVIPRL
jgi:cell wall-associated NlpC family hydrolase